MCLFPIKDVAGLTDTSFISSSALPHADCRAVDNVYMLFFSGNLYDVKFFNHLIGNVV